MDKVGTDLTEIKTIIMKEGCWIETTRGINKLIEKIKAKATPMFLLNGELVGYRFNCSSYSGVTYDLERIIVCDEEN